MGILVVYVAVYWVTQQRNTHGQQHKLTVNCCWQNPTKHSRSCIQ